MRKIFAYICRNRDFEKRIRFVADEIYVGFATLKDIKEAKRLTYYAIAIPWRMRLVRNDTQSLTALREMLSTPSCKLTTLNPLWRKFPCDDTLIFRTYAFTFCRDVSSSNFNHLPEYKLALLFLFHKSNRIFFFFIYSNDNLNDNLPVHSFLCASNILINCIITCGASPFLFDVRLVKIFLALRCLKEKRVMRIIK